MGVDFSCTAYKNLATMEVIVGVDFSCTAYKNLATVAVIVGVDFSCTAYKNLATVAVIVGVVRERIAVYSNHTWCSCAWQLSSCSFRFCVTESIWEV